MVQRPIPRILKKMHFQAIESLKKNIIFRLLFIVFLDILNVIDIEYSRQ